MTENICDISDKIVFACDNCCTIVRSDEYRIYFDKYESLLGTKRMARTYKKRCPNCDLDMIRYFSPYYFSPYDNIDTLFTSCYDDMQKYIKFSESGE